MSQNQQQFGNTFQAQFGQGTDFNQQQNDFPGLGQQFPQQQQATDQQKSSNPFAASIGSTPFNLNSAKEFVPGGVMAKTEDEFPDLDAGFGVPQKKKNQALTREEIEAQKKAELEALPTKGKPPGFFKVLPGLQRTPTMDQQLFVFQYYPQYSANPVEILDWLQNEAQRLHYIERAANAINQEAYGGSRRQNNYNDEYDEEDTTTYEENQDTTFGFTSNKKKGNAQAKAAPVQVSAKVAQAKKEAKPVEESTKQVKAKVVKDIVVKVDEKEIVQVETEKEPCSMVFIGHVDAGKSTISGQIMLQMGCIDERTIAKYKQEAKEKGRDSWWLAYVMDVGEEEKAKGKTVEVGRATFATETKQFTVFDAPGHKNYVPNMIMGAALADYGGLVISARKGEYEAGFEKDGQTREHVQLAKSLGVQKLVIVVNKMDDQSVKWSETRWNEIKNNLTPFLITSGYAKEDFQFVPISGLTGENLKEPVEKDVCPWYDGPTLIQALDNLPVEQRDPTGPVRIPVLDKMREQGVVAHGKIESGTIKVGDKIMLLPSGLPSQVGYILDHKNSPVMFARPGENVQIRLIHIEDENMVNKGDVIVNREQPLPVTMLFEAELDLLELIEYKPILSRGYQCIIHCHTIAEDCIVKDIIEATEKMPSGEFKTTQAPKFVRSFAKMIVRIQTKNPVCLEKYSILPQLGRFTLRDEGRTIAVGRVTKYKPHKVEASIVVSGAGAIKTAAQAQEEMKQGDKNAPLVFDMESGETKTQGQKMDAIAEEEEN